MCTPVHPPECGERENGARGIFFSFSLIPALLTCLQNLLCNGFCAHSTFDVMNCRALHCKALGQVLLQAHRPTARTAAMTVVVAVMLVAASMGGTEILQRAIYCP